MNHQRFTVGNLAGSGGKLQRKFSISGSCVLNAPPPPSAAAAAAGAGCVSYQPAGSTVSENQASLLLCLSSRVWLMHNFCDFDGVL